VLRNLVVALATTTIRRIDTEVELGKRDGMPRDCALALDNVRTVPKALLTEPVTELSPARMTEVCRALRIALGC
jgi:mRNA interferase MazF